MDAAHASRLWLSRVRPSTTRQAMEDVMKYRVILERVPHKDNAVWIDESRARAQQRADALSDLHSDCRVEWLPPDEDMGLQTIIVRAGGMYAPRPRRVS